MPSPSYTQDLLDKIRALPEDKIAEVADFVEFLKLKTDEQEARRLKQVTAQAGAAIDELEAHAAAAGLLRQPDPQARKLSTTEAPPVHVGGKPASEIVLEDRR